MPYAHCDITNFLWSQRSIFLRTNGQSISSENLYTYIVLCAWFFHSNRFILWHQPLDEMTLDDDAEVFPTPSVCICYIFLIGILFLLGPWCFRSCFFLPTYFSQLVFVWWFRWKWASFWSVYSFLNRVWAFIYEVVSFPELFFRWN